MKNGPELWDVLLAAVRPTFPSAVIAGGAVRDFALGFEPKDIDIFVDADRATLTALSGELDERFDLGLMESPDALNYEKWQPDLAGVLDGHFGNEAVQIIGRRFSSVDELLGQFDLGICQFAYDGEIRATDLALHDKRAGTMTRVRYGSDEAYSVMMDRVRRFKRRYGLRFIDPRQCAA